MLSFSPISYIVIAVVVCYALNALRRRRARNSEASGRLPPRKSTWIPWLGNLVPFFLDYKGFFKNATRIAGGRSSVRVSFLPGMEIHFFQEPDTVREIWKRSTLLKSVNLRLFIYGYIFGMAPRWLALFRADDSGPFPKPYPGSSVAAENRIHHMLYEGTHTALVGSGRNPLLGRFRSNLITRIYDLKIARLDWIEFHDLRQFVSDHLGHSFLHAIFGPNLLRVNPTFVDDLNKFNDVVPLLSKGLPQWLIPKAYRARDTAKSHLKQWYAHARLHFSVDSIAEDGDSDPFWGSSWMRKRQEILNKIGDDDLLASSDLGVAWGALVNLIPSTIMALIHILSDPGLTQRVREEIDRTVGRATPMCEVDIKALTENDLLASIYAETLRLHVKMATVVNSQRDNLQLGKWYFPKGSVGLVSCHLAHMNEDFWNTGDGIHPVGSFWAERFLTDQSDPSSGPVLLLAPKHKSSPSSSQPAPQVQNPTKANPTPSSSQSGGRFSVEGLEGAWVPFGGGHLLCPGRFLAKQATIFFCALLLRDFDVELSNESIPTPSCNFGMGTEQPGGPVQFRMKRRDHLP